MSALFPMFVKLQGKRCLVVGAGKVGEPKIRGLIETGASVQVVALDASKAVQQWAVDGLISLHLRAFAPEDLHGVFLAVVATQSPDLNRAIYLAARSLGILCNVVDVPEFCDFYYGAVVRRGDLQIAISTNGQSPSLAQMLRKQLELKFGMGYARWVTELGETRRLVLASHLDAQRKSDLLHSLASREAFKAALAEQDATEESEKNERSVMV